VLVAGGDTLTAGDLGLGEIEAEVPAASAGDSTVLAERVRIERALAQAQGVVARAAQALGLSRQALYRKMERHGLAVERRVRR
jgi:transcriptional regulator with GAF, ATPase, and Fis domain